MCKEANVSGGGCMGRWGEWEEIWVLTLLKVETQMCSKFFDFSLPGKII